MFVSFHLGYILGSVSPPTTPTKWDGGVCANFVTLT